MQTRWLKDFSWVSMQAVRAALPGTDLTVWQSLDGQMVRAYLLAENAPDDGWTRLACVQSLAGASAGEQAAFHYVVETDVVPEHERELNAWYEQEHLPGLASVPGTIRAARFVRVSGSPRSFACYDLVSPATLERAEWLAVRHTAWSSRVRPTFRNTRRTMFCRPVTSE